MDTYNTLIKDCRFIGIPQVRGNRKGSLSFIYANQHIPFEIARVYYLYDVPGGAERAGHAHKELQQILLSASGGFDVQIDDGLNRKTISLNRPYIGLYIPPFIWRELVNFSSGCVCLALASLPFDEDDYIHDYQTFLNLKKSPKK